MTANQLLENTSRMNWLTESQKLLVEIMMETYKDSKKEELLTDFVGVIQFDTKHETYEEDVQYYLKLNK
tara:strand:- start:40427 stop:40633 length:207 start_codon:yes stop_codon:yes gene_type:complete